MFQIFNIIGLITFAFSGAVKGIQKKMDVFGITVLGLLTALGGGAARDILIARSPEMLRDFSYMGFALAGIVLAIVAGKSSRSFVNKWFFLLSDALGLAMFTVSGCLVARQSNLGVVGIIILGLSTAVGGGILRDIMAGEVPIILMHEFYASCALAGGLSFWLLTGSGVPLLVASWVSVSIVFVLRVAAVKYAWRLPKVS